MDIKTTTTEKEITKRTSANQTKINMLKSFLDVIDENEVDPVFTHMIDYMRGSLGYNLRGSGAELIRIINEASA
jgi:hypothetical protein